MRDPDRYRVEKVNKELHYVLLGDELVGQVRMGMDKLWYAELPGTRGMLAAVQELILAHESIEEFTDALHG